MEVEYFIHPSEWEKHFENWIKVMQSWCQLLGLKAEDIIINTKSLKDLAFYSKTDD
jgi:glycyl-tRNA synthetase (class II)